MRDILERLKVAQQCMNRTPAEVMQDFRDALEPSPEHIAKTFEDGMDLNSILRDSIAEIEILRQRSSVRGQT